MPINIQVVSYAQGICLSEHRKIVAELRVFVMPNVSVQGDMEGFGLVALEAVLCGCFVLQPTRKALLMPFMIIKRLPVTR